MIILGTYHPDNKHLSVVWVVFGAVYQSNEDNNAKKPPKKPCIHTHEHLGFPDEINRHLTVK